MLHRVVERERGGPGERGGPVVLVHGFTQTLVSMEPLAARLRPRRAIRVDLPGHGGSASVRAGFAEAAALLGEAGGRAAYVGYSLGGRLGLRLALARPDLVRALVLLGASPGLAALARRMAAATGPTAQVALVGGAGHAVHLERPEAVADLVAAFLDGARGG